MCIEAATALPFPEDESWGPFYTAPGPLGPIDQDLASVMAWTRPLDLTPPSEEPKKNQLPESADQSSPGADQSTVLGRVDAVDVITQQPQPQAAVTPASIVKKKKKFRKATGNTVHLSELSAFLENQGNKAKFD